MRKDRRGELAERAHRIWEREGRPYGQALDHWLRAEGELAAAIQDADPPLQGPSQPEALPCKPVTAAQPRPRARHPTRTRTPPTKGSK